MSRNIKNWMQRLNVLSYIPEEGTDGWPEADGAKQPVMVTSSEVPAVSTTQAAARPEDLFFVPQDVQESKDFGPNNQYRAVPSVIEYSTTSRGRSRVSIREATPEEARESAGSNVPVTSEVPPVVQTSLRDAGVLQVGSGASHSRSSDMRTSPADPFNRTSSASAQSMRTSTTSIRTSAISTSDASARDSVVTKVEEIAPDTASDTATLHTPGSPDHDLKIFSEKLPVTNVLSKAVSRSGSLPSRHSGSAYPRPPVTDTSSIRTYDVAGSVSGSYNTNPSRFSWDLSKLDRSKDWFTRWFVEWWALEILSWIFSAICMAVIAAVLSTVDGKAPKKLGISVNAFISVFSGFAKSALLLPTAEALGQLKWNWFRKERKLVDFEVMDSASRGAWGSMILLSKTKGITLASVGAAIILLSLPLDLFFQQIVSYPTVSLIDRTANATLGRAILYDPSEELMWEGDQAITPYDGAMNSLVYPYWLGSGIPWDVVADCPTGNCTFDPFHTLAVDFQCTEMPPTDYLTFGCRDVSAEFKSTVQYHGPGNNPNVSTCGWYLDIPGSPSQLMSGYEVVSDEFKSVGEVLATRFFALSDLLTHETFFNGSVNFGNVERPIVDFILATTPGGFDGVLRNNTPVLTECEIHWVVKKLKAEVVGGNLTETALETLQFSHNDGLASGWNPTNPRQHLGNYTMTLDDPHSLTGSSTYGISNITALKVWEVWGQIAPSAYTQPAKSNPITQDRVLKLFWIFDPPHLIKVYDTRLPWDAPANVTDHMSKAVAVMNQIVRRNANSARKQHDVVTGTAIKYLVLIDIQWQWISLPALLLFIALVFLLTTILRSTKDKDQIGIWKTSALAILFNGPGEDVKSYVGDGSQNLGLGYMQRKAGDIKVQLDGS